MIPVPRRNAIPDSLELFRAPDLAHRRLPAARRAFPERRNAAVDRDRNDGAAVNDVNVRKW